MLQIKQICKQYKTGDLVQNALNNVSLNLRDNEFVAILGPSGSGKTTLLNCISCFIPYDSGTIRLGGRVISDLSEKGLSKVRNEKLGFIFQDFMPVFLPVI